MLLLLLNIPVLNFFAFGASQKRTVIATGRCEGKGKGETLSFCTP